MVLLLLLLGHSHTDITMIPSFHLINTNFKLVLAISYFSNTNIELCYQYSNILIFVYKLPDNVLHVTLMQLCTTP